MQHKHRDKKHINVFQVGWLLILLWFSFEEFQDDTDIDLLFPFLFIISILYIAHKRIILPKTWSRALVRYLYPLIVRFRAFHIRQIKGISIPVSDPASCICRNCGDTFSGNFCPRCGQSRNTSRYYLKDAPGSVLRSLFRVDGRFAHTLIELAYRPGYMIKDFIKGRRVRYAMPFPTVFLLTAFYVLTVQLILPEVKMKENPKVTAQPADTVMSQAQHLQIAIDSLEQAKLLMNNKSVRLEMDLTINELKQQQRKLEKADSLQADGHIQTSERGIRLDSELSKAEKKIQAFISQVPFLEHVFNLLRKWGHGNKALRILLTLPVLAIATRWAFYRRKHVSVYNMMEHIFIQAYIASQILLLSILVVPFNGKAHIEDLYEVPFWLIFFIYCWDYTQLYSCSWWISFKKTLLMFVYSLLLVVAAAIAGILLLFIVNETL